MTDYSKLTDREIDTLIAERVCGEPRPAPPSEEVSRRAWYSGHLIHSPQNNWYVSHSGETTGWEPLYFSASHDVCAIALGEINKRSVSSRVRDHPLMLFMLELTCAVGMLERWDNGTYRGNPHDAWALVTATPRQKCEALLRAMDANKRES